MFRMDTDGSILRTNNQNLGSYCMNLGDMIGLYSDEAEEVAEKPRDESTADTGNYGRCIVLSIVPFKDKYDCGIILSVLN